MRMVFISSITCRIENMLGLNEKDATNQIELIFGCNKNVGMVSQLDKLTWRRC